MSRQRESFDDASLRRTKEQALNWAFAMTLRQKENPAKPGTVLGSQFNKPLLEFSGACAGCGKPLCETIDPNVW